MSRPDQPSVADVLAATDAHAATHDEITDTHRAAADQAWSAEPEVSEGWGLEVPDVES